MRLTENFHLHEFDCNDGTPVPEEYIDNVQALAEELQELRYFLNEGSLHEFKIIVNSGWRSETHNLAIGGSSKSQHLEGLAADIVVMKKPFRIDDPTKWEQVNPDLIASTIEVLIAFDYMEQGGVGRYDTFTHYDIRGTEARWDQRSKNG